MKPKTIRGRTDDGTREAETGAPRHRRSSTTSIPEVVRVHPSKDENRLGKKKGVRRRNTGDGDVTLFCVRTYLASVGHLRLRRRDTTGAVRVWRPQCEEEQRLPDVVGVLHAVVAGVRTEAVQAEPPLEDPTDYERSPYRYDRCRGSGGRDLSLQSVRGSPLDTSGTNGKDGPAYRVEENPRQLPRQTVLAQVWETLFQR